MAQHHEGGRREVRLARWYFGGLAGSMAACFTHPLDLLKVHLQTQSAGRIALVDSTVTIVRHQSVLALYNGLSASILRQRCASQSRSWLVSAVNERTRALRGLSILLQNSGGSQDSFSDPSTSGMLAPLSDGRQGVSSGPSQELTEDWSQPGCSTDRQVEETVALSLGSTPEMCTICLVRPKCGILVHGRASHRLSCYKCALQLQKRNQPCPVCRRRIQRVVRNFDA